MLIWYRQLDNVITNHFEVSCSGTHSTIGTLPKEEPSSLQAMDMVTHDEQGI